MFTHAECPEDPPPVEMTTRDAYRKTVTYTPSVRVIQDVWDGGEGDSRNLDDLWTGETCFFKFSPHLQRTILI